jgi:hypothetical protein
MRSVACGLQLFGALAATMLVLIRSSFWCRDQLIETSLRCGKVWVTAGG